MASRGLWWERKCFWWKLQRRFWSNCFVMCAFHSGSYNSFLIRQCLNTVPVKQKKWYFAAHWRPWQKVKYPEMKTRKKCSKKLLSDVCIHFRGLNLTLHCPVWKLCLWGICEAMFRGAQSFVVSKETSSDENWREVFWKAGWWCVHSTWVVIPLFS